MSFPAPYERFRGEVLPEWIDHNGHMNLAYYTVLFDQATDLLFEEFGLGREYRDTRQLGTFVAETHNLYERELLVGAAVRVVTQIVATDAKRLHVGHEMYALDGGYRAACQELMFLHVDLAARRVCPFPPDRAARIAPAAAAHATLARPAWIGRRVAMPT